MVPVNTASYVFIMTIPKPYLSEISLTFLIVTIQILEVFAKN